MVGYVMALGCSLAWAVAVIIFKKAGDQIHPVMLNFWKNLTALVLMIPTLYFVEGSLSIRIETSDLAILLISGMVGIGIADAMFLRALNLLGAGRIAIVDCLYSPFVITLSLIFLGETLSVGQFIGTVFILAAILCVTVRRKLQPDAAQDDRSNMTRGLAWGVTALFFMASGIVAVKPVFATVPLFWIITLRLAAGSVASLLILQSLRNRREIVRSFLAATNKKTVTFACFLGSYLAMIMWVAGYKFLEAGVAAVLNQTATVFIVLLAALFLKERLTPSKIIGTALALTGVILITTA